MRFSEEQIEHGAQELHGLVDKQLETLRDYDPEWDRIMNESTNEDVIDNLYEYETLVLERLIEKLKEDLLGRTL